MSLIAPTLQAWFTERLITQRNASPQTIASYRDTLRLLLAFASERTGKQPCELDIDDLDAPLIGAFLTHLEQDRGNSARTRNARLAAIHSLYRYAALRHPEHLATIGRVMAIPFKRHRQGEVSYLTLDEVKALLAAPDRSTWLGRRDHALLLLAIQTGVRVTELVTLRIADVSLTTGAHIKVEGKGRKRRTATLTRETVAVLRQWLKERQGQPQDPLFPTRQGQALTRYGVSILLSRHTTTAAASCPSLNGKRVTPHTLRHTNAMLLRAGGVDIATIALWLGHYAGDGVKRPGSEAGERRVRCDVVARLIEQRDGCGHLDCLVGDEQGDVGVGVVLERESVGEPQLDAGDVEPGGVDASAGVEPVGPAATCEVDPRR